MTKLNLMYVASNNGDYLTLTGIGSHISVCIRVVLPLDVLRTLVGRHVWVNGDWDDICTIHSWPDLPTKPKNTKEGHND
jgi:hypothetical protein